MGNLDDPRYKQSAVGILLKANKYFTTAWPSAIFNRAGRRLRWQGPWSSWTAATRSSRARFLAVGTWPSLGSPPKLRGSWGLSESMKLVFFLNSCAMDIPWTLQILAMNQLFHPCTTSLCFPHAESMPAVFHSFSAQTRLSYGYIGVQPHGVERK